VEKKMNRKGEFRIEPSEVRLPEAAPPPAGAFDFVVPYTNHDLTAEVLERAATYAGGLNARVKLIAVYVSPYPADLVCPKSTEEHLIARMSRMAAQSSLPVSVQLVVARDREEGFRHVLPAASTVLMGTRKHWWRTGEERLARGLTRDGHHVSLLYLD
jgi:hypothetical protein